MNYIKQENKLNEEKLNELTNRLHNILYSLRSLGNLYCSYAEELEELAKGFGNRSSQLMDTLRWYKKVNQCMVTAWMQTEKLYQKDPELLNAEMQTYNVMSELVQTAFNCNFDGTDRHKSVVVVMPKEMYPKFLTWHNRYFHDIDLYVIK